MAGVKAKMAAAVFVAAAGTGVYEGTVSDGPENFIGKNEIVAERTATTAVYDRGDGRREKVSYARPVHYKEKGEWRSIDARVKGKPFIRRAVSERPYEVTAGPWSAEFPEEKKGDYRFEAAGIDIEYEAAFDTTEAVEIRIETRTDGVKETVVLRDRSAPARLDWSVRTNGTVRTSGAGWDVIGEDGETAFRIEPLTAVDASGRALPVRGEYAGGVLTALVDTAGAEWPIEVDPSTVITAGTAGYVFSDDGTYLTARNAETGDTTDGAVYVRNSSGFSVGRSFVEFNTTLPEDADPDSAEVCLFTFYNTMADGDDRVWLVEGTFTGSRSTAWFNDFAGWAATGAYSLTDLWEETTAADFALSDTTKVRLNQAGLDAINTTGSTKYALLLGDDASATEPTGTNQVGFRGTSTPPTPYMKVWYTIRQQYNKEYTKSFPLVEALSHRVKGATYSDARSTVVDGYIISAVIDTIGQWGAGGSDYRIYRASARTDTLPRWNVVKSARVILNGVADQSDTDFNLTLLAGTWDPAAAASNRFWQFDGHESGTTPMTGTSLGSRTTSGFVTAGPDTIELNAAGLAYLLGKSQGIPLINIVSSRDYAGTAPSATPEFVVVDSTGARLEVTYALNDSTPADISVTAISPDSVLVEWRDRALDETGYQVVDAHTGTAVSGVLPADTESVRIGGLDTNTLYALRAKILGGTYADSLSAADSTYTLAATPGAVTVSFPADTLLKFILNPNGNPEWTVFALQDSASGRYIHAISGPDSFGTEPYWGTYEEFGGAGGDSAAVLPGKKYTIRAKAKSGRE